MVGAVSIGVASAYANDVSDPFEKVNRVTFKLNDKVDKWVLKPIAVQYVKLPAGMRDRVTLFFANLDEVKYLLNNGLQGKWSGAGVSMQRFLLNTSFGVFGFFDVATPLGYRVAGEDFGQTLGYWGISSGPYVVLPLLGPSTVRDTGSEIIDTAADPQMYLFSKSDRTKLTVLWVINKRAEILSLERVIRGDRYLFVRDAFLQKREFEVTDGMMEDDFLEDDF